MANCKTGKQVERVLRKTLRASILILRVSVIHVTNFRPYHELEFNAAAYDGEHLLLIHSYQDYIDLNSTVEGEPV